MLISIFFLQYVNSVFFVKANKQCFNFFQIVNFVVLVQLFINFFSSIMTFSSCLNCHVLACFVGRVLQKFNGVYVYRKPFLVFPWKNYFSRNSYY